MAENLECRHELRENLTLESSFQIYLKKTNLFMMIVLQKPFETILMWNEV